jgi:hypothetical protein
MSVRPDCKVLLEEDSAEVFDSIIEVWRCRWTVSKSVLKVRMLPALEARI